jgi:hypothetical protein
VVNAAARLARLQQLLAALPGQYGNGFIWMLIEPVSPEEMFARIFAFSRDYPPAAGNPAVVSPAPANAAELAAAMPLISYQAAQEVFVGLTARTLAYRTDGRYPPAKAAAIFQRLADLLGPGSQWFSNTDLAARTRSWRPVTGHAMDALLAGSGAGILVALLAADDD